MVNMSSIETPEEIRAIMERIIELKVEKEKRWRSYSEYCHSQSYSGEVAEGYIRAIWEMDEELKNADKELKDAYARNGVGYSGTKCDTVYNMYTYREMERAALMRLRKE